MWTRQRRCFNCSKLLGCIAAATSLGAGEVYEGNPDYRLAGGPSLLR